MNPDDRSRGALKILQKLGVEDASKVSKPSVNYCLHDVRTGKQCGNCSMWLDRMSGKDLSYCSLVEGLVRLLSPLLRFDHRIGAVTSFSDKDNRAIFVS